MSDGFIDPAAGRYHGDDPHAARAFREIQRSLERLRIDPIYVISEHTAVVGQYRGISIGGRSTANGVDNPAINYGMKGNPSNQTHLLINVLESHTNASHVMPVGSIVTGSRRPGVDENDRVFFMFATGTNSIHTGGGGSGGGDGSGQGGGGTNTDGGGVIIIGGGGGGGGDPGGGGDDGMCPYIKTVIIAGTATTRDGSWTCTWDGGLWKSPASTPDMDGHSWTVYVQGSSGAWYVNTDSWAWLNPAAVDCPPDGSYPFSAGADPSATATVS